MLRNRATDKDIAKANFVKQSDECQANEYVANAAQGEDLCASQQRWREELGRAKMHDALHQNWREELGRSEKVCDGQRDQET